VRWTGSFVRPGTGDYKLGVRINYCYSCENVEKFRLYVDGKQILESTDKPTGERGAVLEAPLHFDDIRAHPIRLEYFHGGGSAGIDLTWQAPAPVLREEALRAVRDSVLSSPSSDFQPIWRASRCRSRSPASAAGTARPSSCQQLGRLFWRPSARAVNGEEGGTAIAETLAGINNPAGRLPLTFYASTSQLPAFSDYSMKGRTYRYFKGEPLFSFGYGLSYTRFAYSKLPLPQQVSAGAPVPVQVEVTNAGSASGDEVVELYPSKPQGNEVPSRELVGFRRVHLDPGSARTSSSASIHALSARSMLPATA
jgi:beta-glucosidase